MGAESKYLEKLRKMFINDSVIKAIVGVRVYASHISSVNEPTYPAISLHLLPSRPVDPLETVQIVTIQIDGWFPAKDYTEKEVLELRDRIKAMVHRQNLTDTVIGLISYGAFERSTGPLIFEEDTQLRHFPLVYEFVGA